MKYEYLINKYVFIFRIMKNNLKNKSCSFYKDNNKIRRR